MWLLLPLLLPPLPLSSGARPTPPLDPRPSPGLPLVQDAHGSSAPKADPLAHAFEIARGLESCSARYALTSTLEPGESELRLYYRAPGSVRIDRIAAGKSHTMWCVDGVFALESHEGKQPSRGRIDSAAVAAELAPIETALRAAFPRAEKRAEKRAAIGMGWGFDATAQKTTFGVEAQMGPADGTPLGWLDTLREKGVAPVEDGELLRFSTDGHCEIAISKSSAFLQSLRAESPNGRLSLELRELSTGKPLDPALFQAPAPAQGFTDVSSSLERAIRRVEEQDLRRRIYAAASAHEPWDDAARAGLDSVLRPFHAAAIAKVLEAWRAKATTINATIADRLDKLRTEGKSPEEVEAARVRERGYLTKQLDELEQGFASRLTAPEPRERAGVRESWPRQDEILTRELAVIRDVFRTNVREPVLAAFDQATQR